MKENLHDIDKLFKAALENQEETTGDAVWNNIDKYLDKHSVVSISRKYVQLKRVAVALVILLMATGIYTISQWKSFNEKAKQYDVRNEKVKPSANKNDPALASGDDKTVYIIPSDNSADENTANIEPGIKKLSLEKSVGETASVSELVSVNKQSNSTDLLNEKKTAISVRTSKILAYRKKQTTTITNAIPEDAADEIPDSIAISTGLSFSKGIASLPIIYPKLILADRNIRSEKIFYPSRNQLYNFMIQPLASTNARKISRATPFAVTLFIAPNFSSNQIKHEQHELRPGRGNDHDDDEIREGENHALAASVGLLVDYSLNKRWSIQSGIIYVNKSIHINPKTIYANADNNGDIKYRYNCSSGYLYLSPKTSITSPAIGDSIQAYEATTRLQYLSIPLSVKYSYPYKKLDLFVTAGAAINILTAGKIVTEIENGTNKETTVSDKINGLKQHYYGGNLSFGAAYNVSNKIAISFAPIYNFAISSSTEDATVKSYPNNISLATGIRYRL